MIGIVLGIATGWAMFFAIMIFDWLINKHPETATKIVLTTSFAIAGWIIYYYITGNPI